MLFYNLQDQSENTVTDDAKNWFTEKIEDSDKFVSGRELTYLLLNIQVVFKKL